MILFSPLHEEDMIVIPNLQKGKLMMKWHLCSLQICSVQFFCPSLHPEGLTSQGYFSWSPWPLGFLLSLAVGRTKRGEMWEKRPEYLLTCLRFWRRMPFSMITAQITGTTCVPPKLQSTLFFPHQSSGEDHFLMLPVLALHCILFLW